jgi:hypothetical protein
MTSPFHGLTRTATVTALHLVRRRYPDFFHSLLK